MNVNVNIPTSRPKVCPSIEAWLAQPRPLLIDGKWVPALSGKTFPVFDPATGEKIADVAEGDAADIDLAVKAARRAFESGPWARMTPSERGRIIHKLGDLVLEHADELATLEALDNGKPKHVARAADVTLSADMFHYMAGWATKIEGKTISISALAAPGVDFFSATRPEPIGVVGQIIPWNFPLLMAAWKLGPALTTGCTVVLKVAEETPLSALRLGELILEAGVPAGVVNIIAGFGETAGAALSAHPDVDKVAFTGSTDVGRLIVKASAGNLKKVSLELGGKSPNIVLADADVELAIQGATAAVFFNHGQCCNAGSRLFVHRSIFDRVVEGVAAEAAKIKLGHGLNPDTEMGPLVSQVQYDRVTGLLASGRQQGATAVCGGAGVGGQGYFVPPTIFTNTTPSMRVVAEEIFGPVLVAAPFDDVDDALIAEANNSIYGLAAGVWSTNTAKAQSIAHRLKAGTVWVNCYHIFDAALPFGGYKQSGWGREMGQAVLNNYLETKAITTRLG
ncbi:aldehyde dehydrogenase family protein [Chenggangzhangella methanolivorans]|uniref:Aldehyde dehydrogenase family protein n=1 Tax=Chenggangzhangella methanolivorans TaxID=1437009 RepID=A0A9E6RIL9_9HYPH|nr:aldehyde dehydrogenase family protein [Chenggangzhangella methanolivorans]QZO02151.1 aldehyde dehydrogenase family protein [Chenggangzhangella methanolivorans]